MHKKLMILGPTEIEEDILNLGVEPQVYMRTPEFSLRLEKIYQNLQYVFQTQNPVLFFAASGTGAMEAAVTNVMSKGDDVVVINGGSFGHRWVEICQKHSLIVQEVEVGFGKSVEVQKIARLLQENHNIRAVFATLDETSSGALTDIEALGRIIKAYPDTLLIVDCVSGLIVEPMEMDNWGIDVAVSASQKAFAIPPGLAFMAISEKALKKAETADLRTYYFDVFEHIKDWKRNQTPFTPAVGLLFQLERRLEKIVAEGLDNIRLRYADITDKIRQGLKNLGFEVLAENPANCVSAFRTKDYDASEIVRIMSEKYDIEIAPSGGDLKTQIFRVGNFGNINDEDVIDFIKAFEQTLKELNCGIQKQ